MQCITSYQSTDHFHQPTPNCGSSCEKVTGTNVINVLKGALGERAGGGGERGLCHPGAKAFLIVTDKSRSRLDSPFCVITQHRKFEFGHHRQSKKISNAQELTMQLSQTLSSAIAQIKVSNRPITITQKRSCPSTLLLFVLLRQARHILDRFCLWLRLLQAPKNFYA